MIRFVIVLCSLSAISCYIWNLKEDVPNCRPDCESKVYCRGELLHDVQTQEVFDDGTTFVELGLRFDEEEILRKYEKLRKKEGKTPSRETLRIFVAENFMNDSLPTCSFQDFNENPSILKATNKKKYQDWLRWLNRRWVEMGGQLHEDVKKNPHRHSFLWVPNKFVKAGGRFTGTYYWDSYWIIKGLLLSDMRDTARGMIENVIWLVDHHGHMPNGNRNYYLQRSQPPMLTQMAAEYYDLTKNASFIEKNLPTFVKEFQWWVDHRSVVVDKGPKKYRMFRYKTLSCDPRPESYKEDYDLVKNISSPEERMRIFTGVRSAAETGWDFSSRHIRGIHDSNNGTLRQMDPMNMIYVDLNSILHSNAMYLKQWHKTLGKEAEAKYYDEISEQLFEGIDKVLWNDTVGVWLDYDLVTDSSRDYFFVSNLTPLWSKSYKKKEYVPKVVKYLRKEGIVNPDLTPKYYCVPTSTDNSTQQWDFPNCWAPLQAFIIHGLENTDNADAKKLAFNFAQMWISTTYAGYHNESEMYEKYNALSLGSTGGGGEYAPQTGFGWTNGLTMDLFNMYRNKLE